MDTAITTHGLTKTYGERPAIVDLDLAVPRGTVCGYLGPNGAGKTTTIRVLAGLLRPTAGRAEVLDLDCVRDRDTVQSRIGYLPGEFVAYPDLTGDQYLRYLAALRGGVEPAAIQRVSERLDLDLDDTVAAMSHGNRQKLGIVQAFMHAPEVLILDEPTAGLDPLVQRQFLDLVRESRDGGTTVFLSSHILSEVEAVSDLVAILREGRLVATESISGLKAQALRRIDLHFAGEPPLDVVRRVPGVSDVAAFDHAVQVVVTGSTAELLRAVAPYDVENVVTHEPDLEEIFMRFYEEGAGR